MWCYRKTLKIKWTERITNEVLTKIEENKNCGAVLKLEETK